MSKLKLRDLKKYGLELSKNEAQELHPIMNHISQRGDEVNEVYPGNEDEDFEQSTVDTGDDVNSKLQALLDEADVTVIDLNKQIADKDQEIADLKQTNSDQEAYIMLLKGQLAEPSDEDPEENTQGPDNIGDDPEAAYDEPADQPKEKGKPGRKPNPKA